MQLFSRLVWTILIHVLLEENSHLRYHSGIWDFTIYQLHFWTTLCYCISSCTLRTMLGHCIPNSSALWIVYCVIGIVTSTLLLRFLVGTILHCCFLHLWGWSLYFANYMWISCQMLQEWNNSCLSHNGHNLLDWVVHVFGHHISNTFRVKVTACGRPKFNSSCSKQSLRSTWSGWYPPSCQPQGELLHVWVFFFRLFVYIAPSRFVWIISLPCILSESVQVQNWLSSCSSLAMTNIDLDVIYCSRSITVCSVWCALKSAHWFCCCIWVCHHNVSCVGETPHCQYPPPLGVRSTRRPYPAFRPVLSQFWRITHGLSLPQQSACFASKFMCIDSSPWCPLPSWFLSFPFPGMGSYFPSIPDALFVNHILEVVLQRTFDEVTTQLGALRLVEKDWSPLD